MHGSAESSVVSGFSLCFVPQIPFSKYFHSVLVIKEAGDQTWVLVRVGSLRETIGAKIIDLRDNNAYIFSSQTYVHI